MLPCRVGVGGHALHGGYGFSSHTHGLSLDWIEGATVVLANASVVDCSATENVDLFWAIRGAGSSFGIVTEFRFNTFAVPEVVVPFTLTVPAQEANDIVLALASFQNYTLYSMPSEMNMRVEIQMFGGTEFQGLYHGNASDMEAALQPLLSMLNVSFTSVQGGQETNWMGGFDDYAYSNDIDITTPSYSEVSDRRAG
jgi:FAD/FMN-containing dehydrogenase